MSEHELPQILRRADGSIDIDSYADIADRQRRSAMNERLRISMRRLAMAVRTVVLRLARSFSKGPACY
jgi:hypothetical protein